jgi:hypothetical protein
MAQRVVCKIRPTFPDRYCHQRRWCVQPVSVRYGGAADTVGATKAATRSRRTCYVTLVAGTRLLDGADSPLLHDGCAGHSVLLGQCLAAGVTVLLVLGLGLLLVAEYALLWVVVFAPWVTTFASAGDWYR